MSVLMSILMLVLKLHTNTSSPDVYDENNQTARPIWNYVTGTLTSWKGAKQNCIIQLNMGKCTPMQVIKQPEHERTSTTKEQKWSSFQMNYD